MLRYQYCRLDFLPKDTYNVMDMRTDLGPNGDLVPEGVSELLHSMYRKHGWPHLNRSRKEVCLANVN